MLTIAAIAALSLSNALPTLSDAAVIQAHYAVQFARDPAWMGDEPHLRCEVDACGLSDEALVDLDQAVWSEMADREERRHQAHVASLDAIVASHRALPLAA